MSTITVSTDAARHKDLVAIPRKEYERLRGLKRPGEFVATRAQKNALRAAEKNLVRGNTFSYHELVKKLGVTH